MAKNKWALYLQCFKSTFYIMYMCSWFLIFRNTKASVREEGGIDRNTWVPSEAQRRMCLLRTWTPTPGVGIILQPHRVKQTHVLTSRARTYDTKRSPSWVDALLQQFWRNNIPIYPKHSKATRLTLPVSASRNRSLKESCDLLSSGWI